MSRFFIAMLAFFYPSRRIIIVQGMKPEGVDNDNVFAVEPAEGFRFKPGDVVKFDGLDDLFRIKKAEMKIIVERHDAK